MFFRHFSLVFLWILVIIFLYSIPGYDLVYENPWNFLTIDKLAHMFLFAMFVHLFIVAARKQHQFSLLRTHARKWALVFALLLGGILEFIQGTYFEMRTTDPADFIANAIGACLGLLIFRVVYGRELSKN